MIVARLAQRSLSRQNNQWLSILHGCKNRPHAGVGNDYFRLGDCGTKLFWG